MAFETIGESGSCERASKRLILDQFWLRPHYHGACLASGSSDWHRHGCDLLDLKTRGSTLRAEITLTPSPVDREGNRNFQPVLPFLKWPGGKRWFVAQHPSILPTSFGRYIEPFLGGGAVFFHLQPARAILSDANVELMEVYRAVRQDPARIDRLLHQHHDLHSKTHYYDVRANVPRGLYARAARFIYLNRTCWNGLYRVNRNGLFNVPMGTRRTVIRDDDLSRVSELLRRVDLMAEDFEVVIDRAERDDLLFVDPPYTVKHNTNNFIKYNERLFSWDDQLRLKEALLRAKRRHAKIVITNALHPTVRKVFGELGTAMIVRRPSSIAADSYSRRNCEELVVISR